MKPPFSTSLVQHKDVGPILQLPALSHALLLWQRGPAEDCWHGGLHGATSTVLTAWLIASLQPSSTYLMIWIVVDCVSFLMILWAFLLLK